LYNKKITEFKEKVENLCDYVNKIQFNEIEIFENLTARSKCDIYAIISDNIEEISNLLSKVKDKNKLLIITSNLDVAHILACIDVTKNVVYFNNTCNEILSRITKVFYENN
jgi:hypothetical protein